MSGNSLTRLIAAGPGGVYRLSGSVQASRLASLGRLKRMAVFEVDLTSARTKRAALSALARGLDFPDYFGGNWDALADCLTDFAWAPAAGYVLRIRGASTLARESPGDFAALLEILEEAAQQWAAEDVSFYVLFDDDEPLAAAGLPLVAAG